MIDRVTSPESPSRIDLSPYDAVVLVSFGGPEAAEEVVPFLENVTRGRGIPRERLVEVGEHYFGFGGRSPINDQCRALLAALRTGLAERGCSVPVYWGNRNWHPFLADTLAEIVADGHHRVLALTTSAYPSYSSCRQYRENLYDAVRNGTAGDLDVAVDRIRQYATHPGFVAASVDATTEALDRLDASAGVGPVRLVFVTHSIPTAMSDTSGPGDGGYLEWHQTVARAVAGEVGARRGTTYDHDLVFCSRSGPPSQPWLEPDVNDHLRGLAAAGAGGAVLVPIGFVSDHMEVVYDLDTEAVATAAEIGLPVARAATAGTHPAFVGALLDLLAERAAVARDEDVTPAAVPGGPVGRYVCPADCCPNLRDPARPALCQTAAHAAV
ncbi:ferrochelatase [Microlunatus ginsengisoli]|uniref:Coproporphyrin III ferrochelatase n=1 Tax=Microlunatus ginsengisoli TaxID=363863 RepID=A0ABP6ZLN5_9ACTN